MAEFNSAASSRSGFVDELALARQRRENTTASDAPNAGMVQLYDQDIAPDQRNTDAPDAETIRQARIEVARQDAMNAAGLIPRDIVDTDTEQYSDPYEDLIPIERLGSYDDTPGLKTRSEVIIVGPMGPEVARRRREYLRQQADFQAKLDAAYAKGVQDTLSAVVNDRFLTQEQSDAIQKKLSPEVDRHGDF